MQALITMRNHLLKIAARYGLVEKKDIDRAYATAMKSERESLVRPVIPDIQAQADEDRLLEIIKSLTKLGVPKSADLFAEMLLDAYCAYFNVPKEKIQSSSRLTEIIQHRDAMAYLLFYHINPSWREIGRMLGKRDHSTAMYSVRKIVSQLEGGVDYKAAVSVKYINDFNKPFQSLGMNFKRITYSRPKAIEDIIGRLRV